MKKFLIITFAFFCFMIFYQIEAGSVKTGRGEAVKIQMKNPVEMEIMEAFLSASVIVQFTMIVLAFMSIISWAVILSKWSLFKSNTANNRPFEDIFFKASSLDDILDMSKSHPESSLAAVFRAGYSELKKIISSKHDADSSKLLYGMDNLQRSLNKSVSNEISYMEKRLSFLATTGSVSPFIGLFGTVFGIMDSFQQIGKMGTANLAVVAPGISEALIATGVGLFAAIAAAVFYYHFLNAIKKAQLHVNNFVADFFNIAIRDFFK